MPNLIKVDLVDSEREIFSGEAEFIIAPAVEGELGIYPHHAPLISKLKPGVLRVKVPEQTEHLVFAISGGYIEIQNNHVSVLADIIERTDELDEARLLEQKAAAMAKIKHSDSTSLTYDVAMAEIALDLAIAQLKALDYLKKSSNKQ